MRLPKNIICLFSFVVNLKRTHCKYNLSFQRVGLLYLKSLPFFHIYTIFCGSWPGNEYQKGDYLFLSIDRFCCLRFVWIWRFGSRRTCPVLLNSGFGSDPAYMEVCWIITRLSTLLARYPAGTSILIASDFWGSSCSFEFDEN